MASPAGSLARAAAQAPLTCWAPRAVSETPQKPSVRSAWISPAGATPGNSDTYEGARDTTTRGWRLTRSWARNRSSRTFLAPTGQTLTQVPQ